MNLLSEFGSKFVHNQLVSSPFCQLRARRALTLFNEVPLITRRALSLYKVYGDHALLVLNLMVNE